MLDKQMKELNTIMMKMTDAQIDGLCKSFMSRRLKLKASVVSYKLAGAGVYAEEAKEAFQIFDDRKEAIKFLKLYLDSIFIEDGYIYTSLTGECRGKSYYLS